MAKRSKTRPREAPDPHDTTKLSTTKRRRQAKRAATRRTVEKKALLILGVHRSGTSALARVCNLLGVELGSRLMPPVPNDNEIGFWEHQDIYHVHQELLTGIGSAWDDVRALPEDWLKDGAVGACRDKILETLRRDFSASPIWAVKDPRICRLVPLWLSVLKDLGCEPYFLLIGRNPLEVAGSLASRNSFPAAKSSLLWLRHLIDAERDTRGHPRGFITYEGLLQDWRRTMSHASRQLGLEWPRSIASAAGEVDQFLQARLRHKKVDDVVLETDPRLSRWVRDAYRAFRTAADGTEAELQSTLAGIANELDGAGPLFEPWIRGLETDLAGARGEIENRGGEVERLGGELKTAQGTIADRDTEVERLSGELTARNGEIEQLSGELSEAREGLGDRDKELGRLGGELAKRDGQIGRLNQAVAERDGQIAALHSSTSWRITAPLRAVSRGLRWLLRNTRLALMPVWWLSTGQFSRAAKASLPYYQRYMPLRVKAMIPGRVRGAVKRRLTMAPSEPKVSIIVIAYNKSEYTIECLRSIWKHTTGVPFELILLDNGSEPYHLENVKPHLGPARLLALHTNRGFGEGNNIAVEHARGEHVLFVNNDVTVSPGWLSSMVRVMEEHPDAGAVGARLVYPDGSLQEAGAFLRPDGTALQRGKGDNPNKPEYNNLEVVDYCSASALLVRRELFLRTLGFDACYDPAYYEDSDLCLKLEQLGYKTYYCPATTVVHHEGATSRDATLNLNLHNVVEINRQKFLARWQERLRHGPGSETVEPAFSYPLSAARIEGKIEPGDARRLRVGLYTPYNIIPGGGERYLFSIAAAMGPLARVDLIAPYKWSRLRLLTVARELSLDVGDIRPLSIEEARDEVPYDLFVAMGNEVVPPERALGQRNVFQCQFPFHADRELIETRRVWLDGYDTVIVNSDFTRDHFQRQVSYYGLNDAIPVEIISPPVHLHEGGEEPKRPMILNVGRFFVGGHNKKQFELVRVFKQMVDRGELEGWEFHLAGAAHPEFEHRAYVLRILKEAEGYPIHVHVNPPLAHLRRLYTQASLYWHATGFDVDEEKHPEQHEHFGITTVEAMSAGCIPVVVATAGQREIVEHEVTGYLWNSLHQLQEYTLKLAGEHDSEKFAALRRKAQESAAAFGDTVFRERISEVVLPESVLRSVPSEPSIRAEDDFGAGFTM